jgi:hypothetical protein
MALYPQDNKTKIVKSTEDQYNRTQTKLVKDQGDAPSSRLMVDPKLPRLFQYHFGGQFNNWIVIPKGRIVSLVPDRERKNFDDNMYYNMLTLANGGEDVVETDHSPEAKDGDTYVRKANKPVGVAALNIYREVDDTFKGNVPVYMTRNTINLPYFGEKAKAEKTEWGSCYGDIKPGDKVMSDANGRFVKWEEFKERMEVFSGDGTQAVFTLKASIHPDVTAADIVATVDGVEVAVDSIKNILGEVTLAAAPAAGTDNVEITYKSLLGDSIEQKVGMVVNVDRNLTPAGWLKYAMPEGFDQPDSPDLGYGAEHLDDEGYPYDQSYVDGYDAEQYRVTGIPGLTDGMNYKKEYKGEVLGTIQAGVKAGERYSFRVLSEHTPMVKGSHTVHVDGMVEGTDYEVDFVDPETGLVLINLLKDTTATAQVTVDFTAVHQMPGMPSNLDFDGVEGSVDILLQM